MTNEQAWLRLFGFKYTSTFLNWCANEDLIIKNPALGIGLPRVERNPTQPPPPELADALWSLPPSEWASTAGILEWEVLPWFYRFSGARCGEIAQLRLMDVVTKDGIRILIRSLRSGKYVHSLLSGQKSRNDNCLPV
jgi:integrase